MSEVAKLLRNEFMESGQVTDTTRQRLKEILEDKTSGRFLQKLFQKKKRMRLSMNL